MAAREKRGLVFCPCPRTTGAKGKTLASLAASCSAAPLVSRRRVAAQVLTPASGNARAHTARDVRQPRGRALTAHSIPATLHPRANLDAEGGSDFLSVVRPGIWILCFAMLLGRLEIFTLLVLLTPAFWREACSSRASRGASRPLRCSACASEWEKEREHGEKERAPG